MAPADVDGVGGGGLVLPGHHHREAVVGQPGKVFPRLLGEDEGVELAVGLQVAPSVDADDVPVRQDQGLGGGDVLPVQGHRPVAYNDPSLEGVALV